MPKVLKTYKLFIGGKFPRSESGRYIPISKPKGGHLANVSRASRKDLRNAVKVARDAQPGWSEASGHLRGQILYRMAEMLEARRDQFIEEIRLQNGSGAQKAGQEVGKAVDRLVYFAGWSDKYQQIYSSVNPVASSHFNFSVPEPTGVVGITAPQEAPLLGLVSIMAPAVTGGNTCVILASEQAPLCAVSFGEVLNDSDVPGGVVNILTGHRNELLPHLSSHMDVNAIHYPDRDAEAVKMIQENASLNVKRVALDSAGGATQQLWESPYRILDFQEIKTTWHPVGL